MSGLSQLTFSNFTEEYTPQNSVFLILFEENIIIIIILLSSSPNYHQQISTHGRFVGSITVLCFEISGSIFLLM
jgi:hypothetical protein